MSEWKAKKNLMQEEIKKMYKKDQFRAYSTFHPYTSRGFKFDPPGSNCLKCCLPLSKSSADDAGRVGRGARDE